MAHRGQAQQAFDSIFEQTANQEAKEASAILINRNLFSSYYLGTLFEKAVRAQQGETGTRMPRYVRQRLQARWDRYAQALGNSSSYGQTREMWLDTLFTALGYESLEAARAEDFKETTLPEGYLLYRPTSTPSVAAIPAIAPDNTVAAMLAIANPPEEEDTPQQPTRLTPLADEDTLSPDDEDIAQLTGDLEPAADQDEDTSGGDRAVLISLLSWGTDFDRPFAIRARRNDMPHKLMERLLASGGPARWGILCNGRRIRLLKRDVVAGRQQYYEVDLETLFENRSEQEAGRKEQGFDTFWTLFRAGAFQPGPDGRCLLDILEQESRKHAEGVSSRLKTSVFQALETLMSALVSRARELYNASTASAETESAATGEMNDPGQQAREAQLLRQRYLARQALDDLPTLYIQSLVFLYRLLFVLYAESRDLLPLDNAVYRDAYSLEPLRDEIEQPGAEARYPSDSFRLWETLQSLFRLINRGCNTTQLVVPAYNGHLFDPASVSLLRAIRIPDSVLYRVLLQLSVTPPTRNRGRERIDYRDLGVEQLGSVYEGLLEYEPRVAAEPMVEVRYKDVRVVIPEREKRDYRVERTFQPGQFYLGRGAGRKVSGSYYTPQPLVDFLVRRTLEPLVQNKSPEEILALKIVDPAMGSGAFLVGACLYLADAYARAVRREQAQFNGHTTGNDELDTPLDEQATASITSISGEIAEEAAELEVAGAAGEGELSEEATRPYRRLVAERCLYGVDLNPMAVELAKVSLWLTTLAGDKPLTFLDANLRCGNSLIGAPLHLAAGQDNVYTIYTIHEEANKRLARMRGDTLVSRKGKRASVSLWDEAQENQQYTIFDELDDVRRTMPSLVDHRSLIAQQPSDTVAQVHEKATIFARQIVGDSKRLMLEQICNLWVASWFWKQPDLQKLPTDPDWTPPLDGQIYTELVSHIRSSFQERVAPLSQLDPGPYLKEVNRIRREVRPFHWELEFPEVYFEPDGRPLANPGFNVVIGNPPWDTVKPNSREFFTAHDPGFRDLERVAADTRQAELLQDPNVHSLWGQYENELENQTSYFRLGDIYHHQSAIVNGKQTGGDTNTYKLFLEKAYNLLARHGRAAQIVKADVYKGQGSTGLREVLLRKSTLDFLYAFSNEKWIFPAVHHAERFALVGFTKSEANPLIQVTFAITTKEAVPPVALSAYLTSADNVMYAPRHLVEMMSPDTLSIMEFRSQRDIDIASKIYGNWPLLGEVKDRERFVSFTREFDMTNDRDIFNTEGPGCSLFEGKMIYQYTDHLAEPRYWIDIEKGREELARPEIQRVEEALDTLAIALSRTRKVASRRDRVNTLLKSAGRGPLTVEDVRIAPDAPRLAFRKIAANTNERTLIATILPSNIFMSDSLNYLVPWQFDAQQAINQLHDIKSCYRPSLPAPVLAYLCGALNSFVLDYVIRFKVSANVNIFYAYQLPAPRLTPSDHYCRTIARRVAQLVCIGPEFDDLRRELLGDVNAHVATIQDERQRLQNEIDALVAHLYGLSRTDLEHILYAPYTFPLVKREIKDGVMAAFDRGEALLRERS